MDPEKQKKIMLIIAIMALVAVSWLIGYLLGMEKADSVNQQKQANEMQKYLPPAPKAVNLPTNNNTNNKQFFPSTPPKINSNK